MKKKSAEKIALEQTPEQLTRQIRRLTVAAIVALFIFLFGAMNSGQNIAGMLCTSGCMLFTGSLIYIVKYKKALRFQAKQSTLVKQVYVAHIEKHLADNLQDKDVMQAIKTAADLPLNDAAFYLWFKKEKLEKNAALPLGPQYDLNTPDGLGRAARGAIIRINFEIDNAAIGITFYWLKHAHPKTSDVDLRNAIKKAVKMERDCLKYFSSSEKNLSKSVKNTMSIVRRENPDFLESSYEAAAHKLTFAMR